MRRSTPSKLRFSRGKRCSKLALRRRSSLTWRPASLALPRRRAGPRRATRPRRLVDRPRHLARNRLVPRKGKGARPGTPRRATDDQQLGGNRDQLRLGSRITSISGKQGQLYSARPSTILTIFLAQSTSGQTTSGKPRIRRINRTGMAATSNMTDRSKIVGKLSAARPNICRIDHTPKKKAARGAGNERVSTNNVMPMAKITATTKSKTAV